MPIALAKKIVKEEFELVAHSNEFSELCIDFIGGEPLLCFDLIEELTEWVCANRQPIPYIFHATTNGTLLTGPMKTWFQKHKKHFYLGLSLDGDPESQEKNRKGSFSQIDINFFNRLWPDQGVKMTISKESLFTLAADVLYLQQTGFLVHFNPAYGIVWSDDDATIYESQLNCLAEHYLEQNGKLVPVERLLLDFSSLLHTGIPAKFCGVGTHMITYDVDGTAYPCHMFSPIVIGHNCSADLKSLNFHAQESLIDPECVACPLIHICPTCYGFNYKDRGNIALRDHDHCRMFKRQAKAACRYQIERMFKKGTLASREEIARAKTLLYAHDTIQKTVGV
jgi:radical SAM protein with 4Fe4S-binding SPASM domain